MPASSPKRMAAPSVAPHAAAAPARRRFLGAAAALLAAPAVVISRRASGAVPGLRSLSFAHTHTGEEISLSYASGGSYIADALARLEWFLRDFRNGVTHPIDPKLFDQLHQLAEIT